MFVGEAPQLSPVEQQDPRIKRCDCGNVTTFSCCELWLHGNLKPCFAPLCSSGCQAHRHEPGTMGFVPLSAYARASTAIVDANHDLPALRSIFWSNQRKAQHVWDRLSKDIPPPAPLPRFIIKVGRKHFAAFEGEVKELE